MKKIRIRQGLIIVLSLLFILGNIQSVISKNNSPSNNIAGIILYVGGSGPGNYTTIWEAVTAANDGDTVYVYDDSSPYIENIAIYHQINLTGENKETTVIDGNQTGNVINIGSNWVKISGFTIQNGVNGLYLDNRFNTTIQNNIIKENSVDGVRFYSSCDYNTITGNIITDNGETGIKFSSFSEYNTISDNLISNNFNGSSFAGFAYGEIIRNSFEDNTDYAIVFNLWCNENRISFNNFINNGKDVVFFTSSLNKCNFNYWGRPRILPKAIFGLMGFIPWFNFDWRPLFIPRQVP